MTVTFGATLGVCRHHDELAIAHATLANEMLGEMLNI